MKKFLDILAWFVAISFLPIAMSLVMPFHHSIFIIILAIIITWSIYRCIEG